MKTLLAIVAIVALVGACSKQPEQPPSTMPTMPPVTAPADGPITDAGAPSCKSACANLSTKLHCAGIWPADSTCVHQCNGITARVAIPHKLACWTHAAACPTDDQCPE